MREATVRAQIKDAAMGLKVVQLSVAGPVPKQWADLPDTLFWGFNRFLTMEAKAPGKRATDGQRRFAESLAPYLGDNVQHAMEIDSVEAALPWIEWLRGGPMPEEG